MSISENRKWYHIEQAANSEQQAIDNPKWELRYGV